MVLFSCTATKPPHAEETGNKSNEEISLTKTICAEKDLTFIAKSVITGTIVRRISCRLQEKASHEHNQIFKPFNSHK